MPAPTRRISQCLSCLTNGTYIGGDPLEEELPVRPLSQQQLADRQRQSTPLPSRRLTRPDSGAVGSQGSRGRVRRGYRGEGMGVGEDDDGQGHGDDGPHTPNDPSHRRRGQGDEHERHELDELEDEDENSEGENGYEHDHHSQHRRATAADTRNHTEERLFQRRQSAHSQLPRRLQPVPSYYAHDNDSDVLRQNRSARRGARDGGVRRRQNGGEDAPPRYEDHVFDRVVGRDDEDEA